MRNKRMQTHKPDSQQELRVAAVKAHLHQAFHSAWSYYNDLSDVTIKTAVGKWKLLFWEVHQFTIVCVESSPTSQNAVCFFKTNHGVTALHSKKGLYFARQFFTRTVEEKEKRKHYASRQRRRRRKWVELKTRTFSKFLKFLQDFPIRFRMSPFPVPGVKSIFKLKYLFSKF